MYAEKRHFELRHAIVVVVVVIHLLFPMLDTWTIHKPPPKLPTDLLLRVQYSYVAGSFNCPLYLLRSLCVHSIRDEIILNVVYGSNIIER